MNPTLDPQLLDQIKTILRRDLKLGPTAVIADDMPFFGGDVDLDSLDMLLLVTSLEKQFGIKVPNEAVGREVFQNVSTLTAFVQQQQNGSAATAPPPSQDLDQSLAKLPHGPAFRFVTSLREVRPGHSAAGVWKLKGDESFFAGHFPGNPIVPGVLIVEALAQISGIAGPDLGATGGKLVNIDVKFEQPVAPPAEIELESTLTRTMGELQLFAVTARSAGKLVASGTVALFRG